MNGFQAITLRAHGLADGRVVEKKIDCVNNGLSDGKNDKLNLYLCLIHMHVIVYDDRIWCLDPSLEQITCMNFVTRDLTFF